MRRSSRILSAVTVAAMAVAGSTAFTGTGLTNTTGGSQFIGGTVTQTVTGATVTGVNYAFSDGPANTSVSEIDVAVTVTGEDLHNVFLVPEGAGVGSFICTWVTVGRPVDGTRSGSSHCNYAPPDGSDATGFTGLTSIDITVGNPPG